MPGTPMQQFQTRIMEMIRVTDEAIALNRRHAFECEAARDFQTQTAIVRAKEAGLTEDHPLFPAFQDLLKLIDDLVDRARSNISVEHIEILTRERTHFNDARTKHNKKNREVIAALRAEHHERRAELPNRTETPTTTPSDTNKFDHVFVAMDTLPPNSIISIDDMKRINPAITQEDLDALDELGKISKTNAKVFPPRYQI